MPCFSVHLIHRLAIEFLSLIQHAQILFDARQVGEYLGSSELVGARYTRPARRPRYFLLWICRFFAVRVRVDVFIAPVLLGRGNVLNLTGDKHARTQDQNVIYQSRMGL